MIPDGLTNVRLYKMQTKEHISRGGEDLFLAEFALAYSKRKKSQKGSSFKTSFPVIR